jgi:hypothetical protein
MNRISIYKITDLDDSDSDVMYYTLKGLREQVLNEWYDEWGERWNEKWEGEQDYTKEQIKESDEDLFGYMDSWNYNVESILEITEDDFPKS